MKAVIVEIRGETAAALGRDGSVFKVKNHAYAVGQTIDVRRGGFSRQLAVLAAAAAAVFLIVGAGIHTYLSPYSLVSLDVNPSLQYTLNRLGLVLSVEAVNGDGDELLQEVGTLNNRSIEDAISITVKQIAEDGYFDGDEPGGMVIAASSHDEQEAARLAENAKETALRATQESEKKVVVAAMTVDEGKVQAAKELGVSPGKLTLVEQLKETASDPETIDVKEWLEKPVKDIMKETASHMPDNSSASSSGESSADGSGGLDSSLPEAPSAGESSSGGTSAEPLTPPASDTPSSETPSRGQTPLEPPPQSKPASSKPASEPDAGSGDAGESRSEESQSGESAAASSEGTLSGSASSAPESGSSGTESGSASHEAPESGSTASRLEPTDDWTPPVTSSESSSRSPSSQKSPGYPLPYSRDPNVSLPWWEQMD